MVIVGSGAGGAAAAAELAEAGADVIVLEAGGHYTRETYPQDPIDAIVSPLPRRRPDGRRGQAADPGPRREDDRRHDGHQLRHLLPRSRPRAAQLGVRARRELGGRPGRASTPRPRPSCGCSRSTRTGWAATASSRWRAPPPSARARGRSPATPASCFQCSSCPFGCEIDAKQAMNVSYLPRAAAAGARIRAHVEVSQIVTENGKATGVEGLRLPPKGSDRPARPYRVDARRAVIVAGGALGTPELLLRSGLGGRAVGRNLHIHPACWVGARYEEEVRGWEGVMQSFYIDEWEDDGILLEATFTPLPFGGAWLLGTGRRHQEAMLGFDRVGSIGVHLSDRSSGTGQARPRRDGAGEVRADRRRLAAADPRDRACRRGPLRGRGGRGLPEHRQGRGPAARRDRKAGGHAPRPRRPAPRGLPSHGHRADRPRLRRDRIGLPRPTARSAAPTASTWPTRASSPPRSASTR